MKHIFKLKEVKPDYKVYPPTGKGTNVYTVVYEVKDLIASQTDYETYHANGYARNFEISIVCEEIPPNLPSECLEPDLMKLFKY